MNRHHRDRNLSKWYGNVLGLSDVTLEIEPGITGLLGPNGAGKSTFMKLLTGQLKPNLGEVSVLGRRIWNAYRSVRQDRILPGSRTPSTRRSPGGSS